MPHIKPIATALDEVLVLTLTLTTHAKRVEVEVEVEGGLAD